MMKQITTLKSPNNHRVWSIDWHPKQNLLASVGQDRNITLWKKQAQGDWVKTQSIVTQHLKTIRCVKFSNKGDKIAVCSFDSLISIYILNESCYQFLTQLQGHENQVINLMKNIKVKCIDWHQTDKKIASCSRDKNIWIWGFNPTTYQYQCENILEGHTNDVKCVKWIDYNTLASCSYDDTIKVWAQNDDDFEEFQTIKGHQSIVWSIDYRNGWLISSSSDFSVMLFKRNQDSLKFQFIKRLQNVHQEPIYCALVFYPFFVTAAGDNSIKLAQIQQSKQGTYKQIDTIFHQNDVNSIRCKKSQNGYLLASCSDDGEIKLSQLKI